jgi:hypothetical protein
VRRADERKKRGRRRDKPQIDGFTFSITDWLRRRIPTRVRSVTDSAGTTDLGSATYE